ncbi:carbamoyltransferase [Streptomyces camponoticapitis]|uniref:Carbamoyltransferase n=1 Tax=Streptomyces camponoticapitis TaxID=1616125 RepID=A0ABQ2F1V9_9ACTN|nr:carbamoyltransferase C-terminal domain-containing protein [Streptomyces camponoticapitis]GGK31823.1 carbamoyltransferase [Streptomyces camponoticapitis]
MKILGISGFDTGAEFKRAQLPELNGRELRILQGQDSAAALLVNGTVRAAAAEERFNGLKATGLFPVAAIHDALQSGDVKPQDLDLVAHGFAYRRPPASEGDGHDFHVRRFEQVYDPELQVRLLEEHFPGVDWAERFRPVPHHLAHAASAYYPSGAGESLILVADGMGENESLTVAVGQGSDIEILHTVPVMHSLGTFYGAVTLYLGFDFMLDEYKVMGLASFGDRTRYAKDFGDLVVRHPNGRYAIPLLARNRGLAEQESLRGTLRVLAERFGPAREPGTAIEQRHMDIAAAAQAELEACLLHVLVHYQAETGLRTLSFAGGVALNCTANGAVSRSGLFDAVHIPPGAGDDGTAVGAAMYAAANSQQSTSVARATMPYWGSSYTRAEIRSALDERPDCEATCHDNVADLAAETARALADGEVVAWFQGAMEFGPRALGHRSILADPREGVMRDRINTLIKHREDFRPFAPVVLHDAATRFFEIEPGEEDRYAHMLIATATRPEHRHHLGAVTHVDGSARAQTLRPEHNPELAAVITEFGRITGVEVLLNTSFNLRGQPIVRDPATALETFVRGGLDRLVIGDFSVRRRTNEGVRR